MDSTVFYQEGQLYLNLSVPLDLDCHNPLKALRSLFWSLDYRCFKREKKVSGRPHAVTARQMVFILVYARLHGCFSSREVEALCRRDLVCIHVLEGRKAPDHSTIDRFVRTNGEAIGNIFAQSVKKLDGLEDHMRNGQLKPAYNIQNIVDSGYIVGTYCSRDRTDYHTLAPAMEQVVHRLGFQYQGVCADSGYGCVENYRYLDEQKMLAYIKTQTFEQSRKRSSGKDPGSKFAMTYDAGHDQLRCINNTILHNTGRKRYGAAVYQAKRGCVGCHLRKACMKSQAGRKRFKQIQYQPEAEAFRFRALQNITSGTGVELRVNRSIQAEGSFSLIKDGLGVRRFLHKGLPNVETEWILLCMATNTMKLQNKIDAGTVGIPS